METNFPLTFFQRIRVTILAILSVGASRRPHYKCIHFVNHMYRLAGIPRAESDVTCFFKKKIDDHRFGDCVFLKEKGSSARRWSHVGILLPGGYLIHMSLYWGEKVTITSLKEILERYTIAFYLVFSPPSFHGTLCMKGA